MYDLEVKLQELIEWAKDAYGISTKEAIALIINKVEKL